MARRLATAAALAAALFAAALAAALALRADPAPSGHGPRRSAPSRHAQRASRAAPGRAAPGRAAPGRAAGAEAPCGAASAATVASVDAAVAQRIYENELHSREVAADVAHIRASRQLLGALASSNAAAVRAAVHTIVYTPHWHIVRLRVTEGGRVLADVGGPDVIAPVSGSLRYRGRRVGSFVMSVQDDLGYLKLVSRFIGVPIDIYRNGSLLMGTLTPAPAAVRSGVRVTIAGRSYEPRVIGARAFPSGTLQAALLVPTPTAAASQRGCRALQLAAWGSVAMHVAARLEPIAAHYRGLVDTLQGVTGGLVFVRVGARQIAGGRGPKTLPSAGTVRFRGRAWPVFSWVASAPARIYFLAPAS